MLGLMPSTSEAKIDRSTLDGNQYIDRSSRPSFFTLPNFVEEALGSQLHYFIYRDPNKIDLDEPPVAALWGL
jgi:hypothetical protein